MEDLKNKQICECGEKTVQEAVEIFQNTDLPYKKAKKLVTGCNKTRNNFVQHTLYEVIRKIEDVLNALIQMQDNPPLWMRRLIAK